MRYSAKHQTSLSLLAVGALFFLAGCSGSADPLGAPSVIETQSASVVTITVAESNLKPGQTTQASVTALTSDGKTVSGNIQFLSQNPSVATVTSKGMITAVRAGTAVIQATVAGCTGVVGLTVAALASPVAAVVVALDSPTLAVGHVAKATAVAKDSSGRAITGGLVSWASLAPSVATVSANGDVTAVGVGSATIKGTIAGVSGLAPLTVVQVTSPVASVSVTIDSTTLAIGHSSQAHATAKDLSGAALSGQSVTWSSLSPAVATVSSSGVVTAVAGGTALIQATVLRTNGSTSVDVVTAPNLASHDFNDGTFGPYVHFLPADEDIIADPTGANKGQVARFHYAGSGQDRNRYFQYDHAAGYGATVYFRGEFYIPVSDLNANGATYQRKLVYWEPHVDYTKYGGTGGEVMSTVVVLFGSSLRVDAKYMPQDGNVDSVRTTAWIGPPLLGNRWYTLEVQQTNETSIAAGNGVLRIWLDGSLIFEKTNMQWTDANWLGKIPLGTTTGQILDPADVYFQRFEVGEQVNWTGTFDEYRYWDNVSFSTKRIGF